MLYGLPWNGPDVAQEAEKLGVAAFCTGEFVDHEAYSTLAQMVAGTERALVGPGIAYAFARTPYAHAAALRSLHRAAPGRLFLGLGSGAYTINRDWFGVQADRPVERMADLVGAVKAWLHAENGQRIVHDGEFYKVDALVQAPVLGRLDIPILVAGFNKRMAGVSGSVADGVIAHGLFTRRWWDEVVRPAFHAGIATAGPGKTAVEHGWVICAVDDEDPARAIDDVRKMIGFYLTVKTYDPFVVLHGWTEEVDAIRAAFKGGDMKAMAAAVTDEMVEAIAVTGTIEQGRQMIAARGDSFATDIAYLAPPSFLVSHRRREAYARNSLSLIGT